MKLLLTALVCALALAGCAGGGPSAEEYREDATEICVTATREAAELAPPDDSAAGVAGYADAAAEIRSREVIALDELEPPKELEAQHRALVNANGAIVRSLRDLARAAEREDRDASQAFAAAGSRAATQAREAASELDLPRCGQAGAPQAR